MKDRVCPKLMELDLYSENKGTIVAGLYVELQLMEASGVFGQRVS